MGLPVCGRDVIQPAEGRGEGDEMSLVIYYQEGEEDK